jgi:lipopolysaccharide biosynthesis protein
VRVSLIRKRIFPRRRRPEQAAVTHRDLGDAARADGDWGVAARHYREHLVVRPDDFPIWVQLGHALKENGERIAALQAYLEALALNSSDADLLVNIGHLHKVLGHIDEAATYYQRSFQADGNGAARDELFAIRNAGSSRESVSVDGLGSSGLGVADPAAAPTAAAEPPAEPKGEPEKDGNLAGNHVEPDQVSEAACGDLGRFGPSDVGSIDGTLGAFLTGWAWDPRNPDSPALVEFFVGDRPIGTVTPHRRRNDVLQAGVRGGPHGFSFKIPVDLIDGDQIEISAKIVGTQLAIGGSPYTADLSIMRALSDEEGNTASISSALSKISPKVEHLSNWHGPELSTRLVAFYLPQFHPFPENDEWWGKGFTEWTNVTKSRPQFVGHYQPRRPAELGFYDLRIPEIQERQAELARLFGLSGFCFYFYWFGGKRLMEMPIRQFANNRKIDFPFCLCWANENWTRRWDGLDSEVLISQNYSDEDDLKFIRHVSRYLRHRNYIRVDGRPLLLIYRLDLLPDARRSARTWREYCRKIGLGEIFVCCTLAFGAVNPIDFEFDAAIEFPPNMTGVSLFEDSELDLNPEFVGHLHDYANSIQRAKEFEYSDFEVFRGVYPGWDNTARRGAAATVFPNSTPSLYLEYLHTVLGLVGEREPRRDHRMIFVNAWNEWAEGAYLEPDERYGYAYGEATRVALLRNERAQSDLSDERARRAQERPRLAVVVHAFYPEIVDELLPWFAAYDDGTSFFFTTPADKEAVLREKLSAFSRSFEIITVKNVGRDIAPFLQIMPSILKRGFRYVLKLHTKKSPHRGDGTAWRGEMFGAIAEPSRLEALLKNLDENQDMGIVGPDNTVVPMSTYIGSNTRHIMGLCRRLGFPLRSIRDLSFVAGTMFVARVEALELLMGLCITQDDFEPEAGQLDGTLAHAIERVIAVSAELASLRVCSATESSGGHRETKFQFAEPTEDLLDFV